MTEDAVARIIAAWQAERPDIDVAPMLVIGRIHRLAQLTDTALRPMFDETGLGNGEFDVLSALRRAGTPYSRTPRELRRAMMVTSGAVSKLVDRLEAKNLVVREPDPRDARSRLIRLTDEGLRLVDELMPAHMANEGRLLSALTDEQRHQLAGLLGILAGSLED